MSEARLNNLRRSFLNMDVSSQKAIGGIQDELRQPRTKVMFNDYFALSASLVGDVQIREGEVSAFRNSCHILKALIQKLPDSDGFGGRNRLENRLKLLDAFYVAINLSAEMSEYTLMKKIIIALERTKEYFEISETTKRLYQRQVEYAKAEFISGVIDKRRRPDDSSNLRKHMRLALQFVDCGERDRDLLSRYHRVIVTASHNVHFQRISVSASTVTSKQEYDDLLRFNDNSSRVLSDNLKSTDAGPVLFHSKHLAETTDPYKLRIAALRALMPKDEFKAGHIINPYAPGRDVAKYYLDKALKSSLFINHYYESFKGDLLRMYDRLRLH